ncbi:MAG TPA: chitobiase/beta-hexosaminidase C-terminal domain-containing protein, partial [Bacillota bacterium]|nr:chitobiase/beta-hexosaminidase C-terminal domain-containing protein [Bacillota bacterium]
PQYPEQRADYSYGFDDTGALRYFALPTPGGPNGSSTITGVVDTVHFSVKRGFFDQPFTVLLTVSTPGAAIYYTTDGTPPNEFSSQVYTGPLAVNRTTTLRAAAFAPDLLPSPIETHTYLFLADVLQQPAEPPGFPVSTSWSTYGWLSDYGMDPNIITDPLYRDTITNDMASLPALSIVMQTEDMFGLDHGLYTHPDNFELEAPCSVELINPDGSRGFQCDAGIKLHGGGSRLRTLKHPMRLMFKGQYGATKLDYPFFPDSPVHEFDQLDLRSDYNNHWTHGGDAAQRARGGLVRDAFFKDLHARMGALSSHSRYVHLYINGLYWGVYNPCERPNASFAASYLGGDKTDYDAINGTGAQLVDGDLAARNSLLSLNTSSLSNLAQYAQIQQYLDVPQYIDYMILQLYGANWDWGTVKNWYAIHPRQPGAGYKYLCWDSERTLEGVNDKVSVSPDNLQANLVRNAEYRLAFADHVRKHFFNDGALTPEAVLATWQARAAQIDRAMVGESARWGDSVPNGKISLSPLPYPGYTAYTPYTREENWLGEHQRLLADYFPYRSSIVLTQFMQAGLYPSVPAPTFNQHGGPVAPGFSLSMTPTNATIYYTLNGADPRVYGVGTPAPSAQIYTNPLVLLSNQVVKARAWSAGVWSALNEAAFTVGSLGVPLCITEIMYNPVGGDAYEFLELQNLGANPADLSGYSLEGVGYLFPKGTSLAGGAVMLLASAANPAAFASRYPGVMVSGFFGGALANNGERLALLDTKSNAVFSVEYKNSGGWPTAADGGGASLESSTPTATRMIRPTGAPAWPSTAPPGWPTLSAPPPPCDSTR